MTEMWILGFSTLDDYTISSEPLIHLECLIESPDRICAVFSSLRVWAIWGREWRPFLLALPFTLVYPTLNLVSFPNTEEVRFPVLMLECVL